MVLPHADRHPWSFLTETHRVQSDARPVVCGTGVGRRRQRKPPSSQKELIRKAEPGRETGDGQPVFSYALCFRTIWELINAEAEWHGAWNLSKLHQVLAHHFCYFQCVELNLPGNYFRTLFSKKKKKKLIKKKKSKSFFWRSFCSHSSFMASQIALAELDVYGK